LWQVAAALRQLSVALRERLGAALRQRLRGALGERLRAALGQRFGSALRERLGGALREGLAESVRGRRGTLRTLKQTAAGPRRDIAERRGVTPGQRLRLWRLLAPGHLLCVRGLVSHAAVS
jgi:hypothetical protein